MTRIIFINRFFFPDHSATSQIVSDLAFHLAAIGWDIHVVTSQLTYDDADMLLPGYEKTGGVTIHRVKTSSFGRGALVGRMADYGSFYAAASRQLEKLTQPGNIIIAKTDPPLISVAAARTARRKGAHLINWLQDLYPEVAAELGVSFVRGAAGRTLASLRNQSLLKAEMNVAIGEIMASRVRATGVEPDKISVIENWADEQEITPVAHRENPLRAKWGLQGTFTIGYSGNLGRAHEYNTILSAAEILRNRNDIKFLFVGGGHHHSMLAKEVNERGLQNFVFKPYQPRGMLSHSLSVADIHWLSLLPRLEGLIVPSKFYGIAAAGRPVIAVTDTKGEIARVVAKHHCGISIAPGNGDRLADAICSFAGDQAKVGAMGLRARQMLETRFAKEAAFAKWQGLLSNIVAPAKQPTPALAEI